MFRRVAQCVATAPPDRPEAGARNRNGLKEISIMSVKSKLLPLAVPAKEESLSVRVDRIAAQLHRRVESKVTNSWKPPVCAPRGHR